MQRDARQRGPDGLREPGEVSDRNWWSYLDPMEWMDWLEDRYGSVATTGLRVVALLVIGIATTDWLGWYAVAAALGGGAVAAFLHFSNRNS